MINLAHNLFYRWLQSCLKAGWSVDWTLVLVHEDAESFKQQQQLEARQDSEGQLIDLELGT